MRIIDISWLELSKDSAVCLTHFDMRHVLSLIRFSHNRKILKHTNEKLRIGDTEVFRVQRGNHPKVQLELALHSPS